MITKIIIISLFCNGLNIALKEKMILFSFGEWVRKVVKNETVLKPLVNCVYCFASVWGTIIYWLITIVLNNQSVCAQTLTEWVIICFSCIFTNGLFYAIISKYENYIE